MTIKWEKQYAQRTKLMHSSAIREMLKLTQESDMISFAGGLPASECFPIAEIAAAAQRVLEQQPAEALQYGITEGYLPLREMLVRHMRRYEIVCEAKNILITSGSQQALDLIGKVFIDPGDRVVVEEPTYLGALQAWNSYGADYLPVPIDADGFRTDLLEAALRKAHPKLIYALPNFQNPSGITLSNKRRVEMVGLADKYQVPIIEDDPYGQLRYDGDHESSLFALDALNGQLEHTGHNSDALGNVLYLSTFSKTLCPGLRLGWMVGPEQVIRRMVQAKQGMDLHTSPLVQMIVYEAAREGFLDEHIRMLRRTYAMRRNYMLVLMRQYFPDEVKWTRPAGGLFLWVTLPAGMNSADLLKKAIQHKVAFVPGGAFYPCGGGDNTLRLNFSHPSMEQIEDGIMRLAEVIKAELPAHAHA